MLRIWLARLLCRVFGHRWQLVTQLRRLGIYWCERCHRTEDHPRW